MSFGPTPINRPSETSIITIAPPPSLPSSYYYPVFVISNFMTGVMGDDKNGFVSRL